MIRLLIVDDEADIRAELVEYFAHKGYAVDAARDGLDAFKQFQRTPPDVVITDLKMPRCPGDELTRRIRKLDPDVPIIVATGHYSKHDLDAAKEAGASVIMKKPIRLRDLDRVIRRLVGSEGG